MPMKRKFISGVLLAWTRTAARCSAASSLALSENFWFS